MAYTEASKRYYEKHKHKLNEKSKAKYHANAQQICDARRIRPTVRYGRAKRLAEKRGIPFELSYEDFEVVWEARKDNCPVLDIPLTHPSMDRIDSSKGYNKDNIQCISTRANDLKKNGTPEEHMKIAIRAFGLSEEELTRMFGEEIKRLQKS
jgi:hypothetical protein